METKFYEVPVCEVVEVKIESAILQGSNTRSMSAKRSGYGEAENENWE